MLIKGLFSDWIEVLRAEVEAKKAQPKHDMTTPNPGEAGRFFDDHCNWQDIPQFEDAIRNSGVAVVASALMGSSRVHLFHGHVLVKEPGTNQPTP